MCSAPLVMRSPVAPFAGLALVLVALAFERAAGHPDIGDAGDGEQRIFLRIVGDRLQHRAVGELERHVVLEVEAVVHGVDHVDALGHQHGALGAADRVDRRLNGGGVVGLAVAKRALVLDVDNERRGGGRRATGGRVGGKRRRCNNERAKGYGTQAQSWPRREIHGRIIRHNAKIWRRAKSPWNRRTMPALDPSHSADARNSGDSSL